MTPSVDNLSKFQITDPRVAFLIAQNRLIRHNKRPIVEYLSQTGEYLNNGTTVCLNCIRYGDDPPKSSSTTLLDIDDDHIISGVCLNCSNYFPPGTWEARWKRRTIFFTMHPHGQKIVRQLEIDVDAEMNIRGDNNSIETAIARYQPPSSIREWSGISMFILVWLVIIWLWT